MNKDKRFEIFSRWREDNPKPETELHYQSNFQLLIAVLLSAQSTDKGVNLATKALFRDAPDAKTMAKLDLEVMKNYIKTIGLFNTKAANALKTCKALVELYDGEVPEDREALEALPGVGRKTANVVLNTAFGQPVMAVDTHIFRVSNRTKIATGKNVVDVEKGLMKKIPKEFLIDAHHWLILHGRYVCTARSPKCGSCMIEDLCEFKEKTE